MPVLPKCSLIISTYNWPSVLECCLRSVIHLDRLPDEVIIADDGSSRETADLIAKYKNLVPVPVHHVWHPDEGFQLAKIRNRAFAQARYEYIIQIDGDTILHPKFVHDHLKFCAPGFFLSGSRILMGEGLSRKIIHEKRTSISLLEKGINNRLNGIRFPVMSYLLSPVYRMGSKKYYVKGCNMSFWRSDLVAVNGYDESFVGWGREDSDLAIRLMNNGLVKRFLKQRAIMYHVWHREACRSMEAANVQRMNDAIEKKMVWVGDGMDKYLVEESQIMLQPAGT